MTVEIDFWLDAPALAVEASARFEPATAEAEALGHAALWASHEIESELDEAAGALRLRAPLHSYRRLLLAFEREFARRAERLGAAGWGLRWSAASAPVADVGRGFAGFPDIEVDLGLFRLDSASLRVSDPCYERSSRSAAVLPAAPGAWAASATLRDDGARGFGNGMMPALLLAWSVELGRPPRGAEDFLGLAPAAAFDVDSACVGLFDDALYPPSEPELAGALDALGSSQAAALPELAAALSRTFLGDGGYEAFALPGPDGSARAVLLALDSGDPLLYPRTEPAPADEPGAAPSRLLGGYRAAARKGRGPRRRR